MRVLAAILIAMSFALAGCSYRDGIYVVVHPHAAARISEEFWSWLASRGFERAQPQPADGYFAIRRDSEQKIGLVASVHFEPGRHSLFIGKWNTRKFAPDEVAIVDDCASWLVSRADAIERGHVSKSATTTPVREIFYARIKKA